MRKCNGRTDRRQLPAWITSRPLLEFAMLGFLALPAWPQHNSTDLAAKSLEDLDGRPVYVPTFGGVFRDVLDMPLDDIERIEPDQAKWICKVHVAILMAESKD
jgi:hypothetical protein